MSKFKKSSKSSYWPTKAKPFRYFIGYDSHEAIAHEICKYSCSKQASVPVEFHALKQHVMRAAGVYWRQSDPKQSTEFTYLRFFVPFLCNYEGWAMFTDDDFMWRADIAELLSQLDDSKAVMVVKHKLQSKASLKLAGVPQENYPRKNWSSVIVFNCSHPDVKNLTLDIVNKEGGKYLHRFEWCEDKNIGELSYEWNWLVDWYDTKKHKAAKVVHWTDGGPYYPDYRERGVDYQDDWFAWHKKYEEEAGVKRVLTPYERFTYNPDFLKQPSKSLPGYANSNAPRWTWADDDAWQSTVKKHMMAKEIEAANAKRLELLSAACPVVPPIDSKWPPASEGGGGGASSSAKKRKK